MNTNSSRPQSIKAIPITGCSKRNAFPLFRRLLWIGILSIPLLTLSACTGGGGGGGSSGSSTGKWDQMKWDQDKWG